ncbi:tryptophan tRS [Acrasis kona]|uniref:Tryptophan--tRNA ligase, cytoplasmic n=1 Tax=Acrasis kona TaxID=1008807 RepID=A0AAW2ZR43_9EUKA
MNNFVRNTHKLNKHYIGRLYSQVVTPFEVKAEQGSCVNYDKLIEQFGSDPISEEQIRRLEAITGKKPHHLLRRGVFFSQRNFSDILDAHEKRNSKVPPFYLYTGRGPSSQSMHIGHLIPFIFTKWLQDTFDVPLVIQMTDDEKFLWKDLDQKTLRTMTVENIKDVIAVGFDPKKTFIFNNFDYMGHMYRTVSRIQKSITTSQVMGCLGLTNSSNIGKIAFTASQAAPCFPSSFPHIFRDEKLNSKIKCLIPCAIDQDPFFRITRDISNKLGFQKPCLIHSKFFPSLQGNNSKMSASDGMSSIFLTDTDKQVQSKINKSMSGGGATLEEHEKFGANLHADIPYQYMRFFMEDNDELERIGREYSSGRMRTMEVKKIAVELLLDIIKGHKQRREQITQQTIDDFMNTSQDKWK